MRTDLQADLVEIFSSIQGEGLYVGKLQTFVRIFGCNLRCDYCDTKSSFSEKPNYMNFDCGKYVLNPVTSKDAIKLCKSLPPRDISLTGGEPLLKKDFVKEFSAIRKDGYRVHLETNGTLKDELAEVIDDLDVIAMDIKLPSASGCGDLWNVHKDFLKIAAQKETFVKAVCAKNTPFSEIEKCVDIILSIDKNIPLILQPMWQNPLDSYELMNMVKKINDKVDARVIPQCHKILGVI